MSRVRSAGDDSVPPDLRDPDKLTNDLLSSLLGDTVWASRSRLFKDANPAAKAADYLHWVGQTARESLGIAEGTHANLASLAAWYRNASDAAEAAYAAGTVGGFKPHVQPAIVRDRFEGRMVIADQE